MRTLKPVDQAALKNYNPPIKRFYNLYELGSDLFRRYHEIGKIDKLPHCSGLKIYSDRRAEVIAQNISDEGRKEGGFLFYKKYLRQELSFGKSYEPDEIPDITIETPIHKIRKGKNIRAILSHDGGEIAGLAFRTMAEVLIGNGIDLVINAGIVKNQIQCTSTTEDNLVNILGRQTLGNISLGIYITSHVDADDKYAAIKLLGQGKSIAVINGLTMPPLIRRISFDAIISGNNPGVLNHGKIEIF